jgi:hypothetical protein
MLPSVRIEAPVNVARNLPLYQPVPEEKPAPKIAPSPAPEPAPGADNSPNVDTVVIGQLQLDKDSVPLRVVVTDLDVDFWTMTMLLVKLAFAVIPAAFIVTILAVFIGMLFKSLIS